jgi:putative transposase
MPRPTRIDVPGVPLHIVQRGNNKSNCFFSEIDRRFYLKCLAEAAQARGCAVHAYVLMSNHIHLLVTPEAKGAASAMLQDVGRRYVRTINSVHGRTGTLWEGRFKSSLIDTERYLFTCHRYIELNPVRAGIVHRPCDFSWSSHGYYAMGRPDKLVSPHPLYVGLAPEPAGRMFEFRSMFGVPIPDRDLANLRQAVNKGWALGSKAFIEEMEQKLGRSIRPPRRGRPAKQPDEAAGMIDDQIEMLL